MITIAFDGVAEEIDPIEAFVAAFEGREQHLRQEVWPSTGADGPRRSMRREDEHALPP